MAKIILLIEDDPSISRPLASELSRTGYEVMNAHEGAEGLAIATSRHPDLILLDLIMPRMGGIDFLRKLRQDAWGATVPVIVLSNVSDSTHVFQSLDNGVQDYLIKADWKLKDLVKQIQRRLDQANHG